MLRDITLRSGPFRRGTGFLPLGEPRAPSPTAPGGPQLPRCVGPAGGQLGAGESRFLAAGGRQQLSCIMESYLRPPKPFCQAVALFFFCGLVTPPSLALRKEEPR